MSLGQDKERAGEHAYGSHFTYDGCWALPAAACGYMPAVLLNLAYLFGLAIFVLLPEIVRWVLQWFMPRSGEGPSERLMESGFLEATNYTSFVLSDGMSEVHVKTVLRGRGDPGYLLTSTEPALALLLEKPTLPELAHGGGVLALSSGIDEVLLRCLEMSGRFELECLVIDGKPESKCWCWTYW
ncbi:hypothetical protein AcV5_002138 [Taiwanofungus camphoratus]|nr:hypothetical protein AcV5_002138 [Antrodia cinnamomea]